MKVPDLMLKYLMQNKILHIQGLGTFSLSAGELIQDEQKGIILPPNSVSFTVDFKTKEDPELIAYISAETGKIKPLAASDLESVILQAKQLLNISKPFTIDGLGTLQKDMRNDIEFIQYEVPDKTEQKRKEENRESIHFDDNYLKPSKKAINYSRGLSMATLVLVGLGLIGLVAYYFYQKSSMEEVQLSTISLSSAPVEDTSKQAITESQPQQTVQPVADSLNKSISLPPEVSDVQFNVVIETANKARAFKRYADLREWGHKVIIYTEDSVQFKIAFPIKAPLSDSIRYRDSLSHFFGRKVWIENK